MNKHRYRIYVIPCKIERFMAKGYWIARVDVTDLDQYKKYLAANALPFKLYGAQFSVRAGTFETLEGSSRSRNIVNQFPPYQAALDCYRSAEYQGAIKLRLPVA